MATTTTRTTGKKSVTASEEPRLAEYLILNLGYYRAVQGFYEEEL
jgi:hypothetical protein